MNWVAFFSYSILLAAIIGLLRFRTVSADYRPFFYLIWIGLMNEIISQIQIIRIHSSTVNCNIYVLIEAILYAWLFYNWGGLLRSRQKLRLLILFLVMIWILDNLIMNPIGHTNSMFRVVAAFLLVFLAIDQINQLMMSNESRLLTSARFLISIGVVIYFTYGAIFESFYWIRLPFSNQFYFNIYWVMIYVNLFVNLIFAAAALWIPTRRKYILPS